MAAQSETSRAHTRDLAMMHRPALLSRLFASIWLPFLGWQTSRATRVLLHSLDDGQLRNIGLARHEIEAAVQAIIWRKQRFGGSARSATSDHFHGNRQR